MKTIVITGASSGLGAALATRLATPNARLHLCARRLDGLEATADACRAQGADVVVTQVDLTDRAAAGAWITGTGTPDLVVLNAGVFTGRGPDGRQEAPNAAARQIDTNLTAPMMLALALTGPMRAAGRGTIVFISSLSAFGPLADAPSYAASKAGITSFARGLREDLAPDGVRVQIAHPGHFATDMTMAQIGALPGIISLEQAADRILAGIRTGRSEIDFPRHLRWALALQGLLPWRLSAVINRTLRFHVQPKP